MKNKCIKTDNKRIELYLESADILNEFVKKGFNKRAALIGVVQDCIEDFKSYENVKKLEAFWALRVHDESLNTQLRGVLHRIENEEFNTVEHEA